MIQDGRSKARKVVAQNNRVFLMRYARKFSFVYKIFSRSNPGCKTHGKVALIFSLVEIKFDSFEQILKFYMHTCSTIGIYGRYTYYYINDCLHL